MTRILVLRVADTEPDEIVDGASVDRCRTCWHEVYVSPQARVHLASTPGELYCMRCHDESPQPETTVYEAVPGAMEAARAHLARLSNRRRRHGKA